MRKLMMAAAAATALTAGAAYANQTDSGLITINGEVAKYVNLIINDATLTVDVPANGNVDMSGDETARAGFTVEANTPWTLAASWVTFSDPRPGVTYEQGSYTNTNGDTIGGSLFIDPTPGTQVPGNNDLIRQDSAGVLGTTGTAGTFQYGLAGAIDATLTPGGVQSFAAPGIYSLPVTLTLSAD